MKRLLLTFFLHQFFTGRFRYSRFSKCSIEKVPAGVKEKKHFLFPLESYNSVDTSFDGIDFVQLYIIYSPSWIQIKYTLLIRYTLVYHKYIYLQKNDMYGLKINSQTR